MLKTKRTRLPKTKASAPARTSRHGVATKSPASSRPPVPEHIIRAVSRAVAFDECAAKVMTHAPVPRSVRPSAPLSLRWDARLSDTGPELLTTAGFELASAPGARARYRELWDSPTFDIVPAVAVLMARAPRTKRPQLSSYTLKHAFEHYFRDLYPHIPQGVVILVALTLGIPITRCRHNPLNAWIAISMSWSAELRRLGQTWIPELLPMPRPSR